MKTTVTRTVTAAVFTLGVLAPIGTAAGTASAASANSAPVAAETMGPTSQSACRNYLRAAGYKVGERVRVSCEVGERGEKGKAVCIHYLRKNGVKGAHAQRACILAGK